MIDNDGKQSCGQETPENWEMTLNQNEETQDDAYIKLSLTEDQETQQVTVEC